MSLTNTEHLDSDSDYCEYDSTWEEEMKVHKKKKTFTKWNHRNTFAARDMQEFRHRCKKATEMDTYIGMDDACDLRTSHMDHFHNLNFYKGQRSSDPDDVYIDKFHKHWWGDYERLEEVHSYIQWLFPIQEQGMNWQAHVLTEQEIELFRKDETAKQNLLKSYKLMLNFYGIRVVSDETGDVEREENWKERFKNLNRYTHNNLRITRILKCLGTLGFEHYQEKLVKFFLHETLVEETLPNVKKSVLDYFMFAVLDKRQRQDLVRFAFKHFQPQTEFVWGPKKFLSAKVTESPKENKSIASGENSSLEEESSRMQEEGVTPVASTTSKTGDTNRDQNPVLDSAENKAMASGESTTLDGDQDQEMEVTPSSPTRNTVKDAGEGNEQKVKSSQSNFTPPKNDVSHCHTGMDDISVKQSDIKDSQVQCGQVPVSDITGEQTSNGSDVVFEVGKENEEVSSNSAQDKEKNVKHVKHETTL